MADDSIDTVLRELEPDLAALATAADEQLTGPIVVTFARHESTLRLCDAAYVGVGSPALVESASMVAVAASMAEDADGYSALFMPARAERRAAMGLFVGPQSKCCAFATTDAASITVLPLPGDALTELLDDLAGKLVEESEAGSGQDNDAIRATVDETLSMVGISPSRSAIASDAIMSAVARNASKSEGSDALAAATDELCLTWARNALALRDICKRIAREMDQGRDAKQLQKRVAALTKENEVLKAQSKGYLDRADRHARESAELQRKLKAAAGPVVVVSDEELQRRLAALYGL